MAELLPSSAQYRVAIHRRFLTAQVYLQVGPFWDAVHVTREAWGITPEVDVPKFIPDENGVVPAPAVCLPDKWPVVVPPHCLRPKQQDDEGCELPSLLAFMTLPMEWGQCGVSWWIDLTRLYDWYVPDDCQSHGPMSEQAWAPFLSQCLIYDPPPERLLEFADAAPTKVDFAPTPFGAESTSGPVLGGPAMIHAPIVSLRNGDDIEQVYIQMYEEVFNHLDRHLRARGINLAELRSRIVQDDPSILERHKDRLQKVRKDHYIIVRPETTSSDVQAAFRLLKQRLPKHQITRKTARTTRSDLLTCIQCALWYEAGLTHGEIAQRFGWTVQTDRTMNQWSESARAHIARGRKILRSNADERLRLLLGQV